MSKHYYHIHSVCFWEGAPRDTNLLLHAKRLENAIPDTEDKDTKNLFIVAYSVDCNPKEADLSRLAGLFEGVGSKVDILICPRPNTGGTVGAMWDVWKYLKKEKITSKYFSQFEDDHLFTSKTLMEDCQPYFDEGYTWVGSIMKESLYDMEEVYEKGYKSFTTRDKTKLAGPQINFISDEWSEPRERLKDYVYIEDPYIMPFESLQKLEDTLGKFTAAPKHEPYSFFRHGIFFGEVGFPSRAYRKGIRFKGLKHESFLEMLDQRPGNRNP